MDIQNRGKPAEGASSAVLRGDTRVWSRYGGIRQTTPVGVVKSLGKPGGLDSPGPYRDITVHLGTSSA